jgi:serine protease AprX
VASIDEVRRIEKVGKVVPRNNQARLILGAPVQPGPIPAQEQAYEGKGQLIAIADTGFDNGYRDGGQVHPAFRGRVLELYPMGGAAADLDGHGTHVYGSAVGDGLTNTNDRIMGTAPHAHLVAQCAGSSFDQLPGDLNQLFEPPYKEHQARVHLNSWGTDMEDEQVEHNTPAKDIDKFVQTHPEIAICWAADNDATDLGRTGPSRRKADRGRSRGQELHHGGRQRE